MEMIATYFIPSLIILFVPVVLAIYTLGCLYEYRSLEKVGPLLMLNVTMAISIGVVILDKQVSTLLTMAMVSYGFIAVLMIAILTCVLASRGWMQISSRLPVRQNRVRDNETILSQSYTQ